MSIASDDLAEVLRQSVMELADVPAEVVALDRPLREIGVDSLMALELVVRVEQRFGIRLSEEEIRGVRTIRDMLDLAASRGPA